MSVSASVDVSVDGLIVRIGNGGPNPHPMQNWESRSEDGNIGLPEVSFWNLGHEEVVDRQRCWT